MLLQLVGVIFMDRLILSSGFRMNLQYRNNLVSRSGLCCNPLEESSGDVAEVGLEEYLGPNSDFDDMEAGCSIADLGIHCLLFSSLSIA